MKSPPLKRGLFGRKRRLFNRLDQVLRPTLCGCNDCTLCYHDRCYRSGVRDLSSFFLVILGDWFTDFYIVFRDEKHPDRGCTIVGEASEAMALCSMCHANSLLLCPIGLDKEIVFRGPIPCQYQLDKRIISLSLSLVKFWNTFLCFSIFTLYS